MSPSNLKYFIRYLLYPTNYKATWSITLIFLLHINYINLLHNNICAHINPFLLCCMPKKYFLHVAQLPIQAILISSLDYCSALLRWRSSCAIKALQKIQNTVAKLSPREPMSHLSFCPMHCNRLELSSSSQHWCLHTKQHRLCTVLPLTHMSLRLESEFHFVIPLQRFHLAGGMMWQHHLTW